MSEQQNNNNIKFDLPKHQSNVIKVIGVGGGGSNAIDHMYNLGIKGVDFVICNTDAQALENSSVPNKIQLGVSLTEGLGAGSDPAVGEQAALESSDELSDMLMTNTKMVFITAGMGGGTGTGAAPVIAKMAKEADILTVGIVTIPFVFEGTIRNNQALKGLEKLREEVDSLIIINNNKLREVYGNLAHSAGFAKADEVLSTAARGIAEVITHHYKQNVDLRDAKTVLRNSGTAIMGSALAKGENRAREAILKALDSPLLNDNKITGAKNVLLLIVSGKSEITIDEIAEISDHIQDEAGHKANLILGIGNDENLEEEVSVTVIATGFNTEIQDEISNTEVKRVVHNLEEEKSQIAKGEKAVKSSLLFSGQKTYADDEGGVEKKDSVGLNASKNLRGEEMDGKISFTDKLADMYVEGQVITAKEDQDIDACFKIKDVPATPNSLEGEVDDDVQDEKSMALTFDLPVTASVRDENQNDNIKRHRLIEDDKQEMMIKNESSQSTHKSEENLSKEIEKDESGFSLKRINTVEETPKESPAQRNLDPTNSPISELLKQQKGEERRRRLKAFNYKFKRNRMQDLDKEPAFKRQGVEIEDIKYSSENRWSRTSLSRDDNDDDQLRSNNSFLHDNVDWGDQCFGAAPKTIREFCARQVFGLFCISGWYEIQNVGRWELRVLNNSQKIADLRTFVFQK